MIMPVEEEKLFIKTYFYDKKTREGSAIWNKPQHNNVLLNNQQLTLFEILKY